MSIFNNDSYSLNNNQNMYILAYIHLKKTTFHSTYECIKWKPSKDFSSSKSQGRVKSSDVEEEILDLIKVQP